VLRLAPAHAVYPVVDLDQQALCMRAASRGGRVPVPRVLAVENDTRWLGKPFLLMERLHGQGAPDWPSYVLEGWIRDLAPSAQRKLWLRAIDAIVMLHATDVSHVPQARLAASGATPLDRMLGYWDRFLAFVHEGGDYPVLQQAVASLHRDRPSLPMREGLVWGDASLRNMLFAELRPVALMDFEFAHVGVCDFDIAFFAIMDHIMAEGFAGGAPRLPGFPGVAETFDYYAAMNGRPVGSRDYLIRTALTYSALATTRVYQRLAGQGRVAPEDVSRNPPLALLGRLMDGSWTPR
jgi:aminoglycoside phosphotransferase (APT) family kinase protein